MTEIYFIRHSIPDFSIKDDLTRPLTKEGIEKAEKLIEIFNEINVDKIFSSPYKRTIQTVEPISKNKDIEIEIIEDFKERKISDFWIDDFNEYCRKQWQNFMYKLENGESLIEVQNRNIMALNKVLNENNGKKIIIETHGTALSTIINYYDKTFEYNKFMEIINVMPYITKIIFKDDRYIERIEMNT